MGKEGELWDDSALLNAFDQAISKYKKMHGKGYKQSSTDDTNQHVSTNITDTSPQIVTDTQNFISHSETVDDVNNSCSQVTVEVGEPGTLGTTKEMEFTNSEAPDEHALGSNTIPPQEQSQNYSSSLDMDEYNQLYKQYYEIEDQRQKILQRMQQLSGDQYPYSGEASISGVHWGTDSAVQQYQSTSQMPYGTMVVTCYPSAGQCSVASCRPLTCPVTKATNDNVCNGSPTAKCIGKVPDFDSIDVVKTALGAAERAISTLKEETPESKEETKHHNVSKQIQSSETDFSTVLNAWYSAGFYTGKYLTERSLAKKQHD